MIVVFRGCSWDEHWEFDAPCVLYRGAKRYDFGGNSGKLEHMIEEAIADHFTPGQRRLSDPWSKGDLKEFAWRGWSIKGFRRRKSAWHVEQVWRLLSEDDWECLSAREQKGPFGPATMPEGVK